MTDSDKKTTAQYDELLKKCTVQCTTPSKKYRLPRCRGAKRPYGSRYRAIEYDKLKKVLLPKCIDECMANALLLIYKTEQL